jgi:transposase
MRQIREILRLHFEESFTQRTIARAVGVVRSTVERVLRRFAESTLTWPPDPVLTDAQLERRLYVGVAHQGTAKVGADRPDYAQVLRELARKGVTRRLLWAEYRARLPDGTGIGYSVFCAELAAYRADRDLAYRHDHVPGEKGYFDFAGLTLRYQDGDQVRLAQIFTAALGWSNAIFAYAFADQTAVSWLDGQQRAFAAFGGVPKVGVPDNPKALVAKADRFEPKLTPVYADFARHYGLVIVPARVRKPKDKGAVEGAVKIVEMRIMAAARDRIFASLGALNVWLAEGLDALNAAPFQKRVGSRKSLLDEERSHLLALPATRFEMASYLIRKVARDYHVDVHRQYYSVPSMHAGQTVEVRLTATSVEILQRDQRIALHRRAPSGQRFVTDPAHMPSHHRAFADPQIEHRAAALGPSVTALVNALFAKRRHPEQAIRSAQGVLGLARDHGAPALNTACGRAVELDAIGYQHVLRLLTRAALEPPAAPTATAPPTTHEHVRGGDYYDRTSGARHAA